MFHKHHRQKLASYGITSADAEVAGFRSVDAAAATITLYGMGSGRGFPGDDGIEIPFHDIDGQRMLGQDGAPFSQFRVFGNRKVRYIGRSNAGTRTYIPPQLREYLTDAESQPYLVITEGPPKALSATLHGIPTVGIMGVDNWRDPSRDREASGDDTLDPDLVSVAKAFGGVIVLADSDASTKKHVRDAMLRLTESIREQTGVVAAFAIVPASMKKPASTKKPAAAKKTTSATKKDPAAQAEDEASTTKGIALVDEEKMGLDDWIVQNHGDVTSIRRYLNKAFDFELQRQDTLKTGGYVAVGYSGASELVFWSEIRQCIVRLAAAAVLTPAAQMSLAGAAWCIAKWGVRDAKTGKVNVDWQATGGMLMDEASAKGPFEDNQERGTGVWRAADGGIIVNGNELWRPDGQPVSRVGGESGLVYPRVGSLPVASTTPQATEADVMLLLGAMESWNMARKSDTIIALGWCGLAYVAGALKNRPMLALTGAKESGKSTFQDLTRIMLMSPRYAIGASMAQSSEAGLRQQIGNSSRPLLIDEAEPEAASSKRVMESLRSSFSGDSVFKGTQDGHGQAFALRSIGMISGITLPTFRDSDETRFITIHLNPRDQEAKSHPLIESGMRAAYDLAPKMFARAVHAWPRFRDVYDRLEPKMLKGNSKRFVKTYGACIAMALALLHDEAASDAVIDDMLARVDLAEARERTKAASAEGDVMTQLLTTTVRASLGGKNLEMTIANLCANAMREKGEGDYTDALGNMGMRMDQYDRGVRVFGKGGNYQFKTDGGDLTHGWYMLIATRSAGFLKWVKDSSWSGGQLRDTLLRTKGAFVFRDDKKIKIGGVQSAPIGIPVDIEQAKRPTTLSADLSIPD